MSVSLANFALLLLVALIAGILNALAGGGTFLVFPTLMLSGLDSIVANATSSATVLPGGAASAWVYRKGSRYDPKLVRWLLAMSVAGGITGSILVLLTPSARFTKMVPYLMLSAALVFSFSGQIQRFAASRITGTGPRPVQWMPLVIGSYLISIYGGYFGAGMGVLMIVLYTLTANLDVQQSAALRFYCTLGINLPAVAIFAARGRVNWQLSIPMAVAAVLGGYMGAHLVRRMSTVTARRAVLIFAWVMTVWLLVR